MTSSIIPDAKYQELNMSFTFDQSQEDKLIIDALVDRESYQTEIFSHLNLDFQDMKSALLSKQFKMVSRSPEIMRLKIGMISFDFKNLQKITLDKLKQTIAELKETITELKDKLKYQSQKNIYLEELIKQLRKEFDQMTTQMSDFRQTNDENKQQIRKIKLEWKEKTQQERVKIVQVVQKYYFLKDSVEKLQEKLLKQVDQDNIWKQEQKRVSKLHLEDMIKKEEELLIKMNETGRIKKEEFENFYQERLKILQERLEGERLKRDQSEKMMKMEIKEIKIMLLEEKQVKNILLEKIKKLEEARDKEQQKQKKKLKLMQERLKQQLESEIFKTVEQEIKKHMQEERLKQKADEERFSELQHEKIKKKKNEIVHKSQDKKVKNKLEQEKISQIQYQQQVLTQNTLYRFSSQHKLDKIAFPNNNTKAVSDKYGGLALVEGVVFENGSSIRFRIQSIDKGWLGIGLGIRNVIVKNKYIIPNWKEIDHGCFLLFSGGTSYSHSNKAKNNVKTDFSYSKEDVIKVERSGDELLWMNENKNNQFRMKLKLTADEWGQACFCVFVRESSVQIMK